MIHLPHQRTFWLKRMECMADVQLQGQKRREWEESKGRKRLEIWETMLAEDGALLEDLLVEGCPFVLSINEQEEGCLGNLRATKFFDPFEGGWVADSVVYLEKLVSEMHSDLQLVELQRAFETRNMARKDEWEWPTLGIAARCWEGPTLLVLRARRCDSALLFDFGGGGGGCEAFRGGRPGGGGGGPPC